MNTLTEGTLDGLNRESWADKLEEAISIVLYGMKLNLTLQTDGRYWVQGHTRGMSEFEFVRWARRQEDRL